jgi:hypothetical protein
MTTLVALWLPILLSAVFVFVVSSLVHMVLQIHKGDYQKLPNEVAVLGAMRESRLPPGQYIFPCPTSMKDMGSPEMLAKFREGPVGTLIVRPTGLPSMGRSLGQWFLFCIVVGIFVAYISGQALAPGAAGMRVFRLAGSTAILGYAFSSVTDSIWKGIAWKTTARFVFDGLLYGLTTGAVFAWLWPAA